MGTETMESMLELALDAFQSKNFELAADIYECQLEQFDDPAIQQELLVRRADALALGGKLNEAFDSYKRAAELERLRPVQLENLIECLSTTIRRKESSDRQNNQHVESIAECGGYDTFSCAICCGFLHEPVTLPCGHCFCKKCLEREKSPICCKNCKSSSKFADMHKFKVNVVISNLLSKWFPSQLLAVKLRREGNGLYAEKRMEAALEKYNEAIQLAPGDHVLYSNRSQINSSLRNFEDALSDAEMACKLKPQWVKGHIRKAQVLSTLGETEKALSEYLLLISLDPESKVARTEAQKLLSELLAPVTEHVQRKILDCSSLLSSRARVKNIASTPSGLSCTSSSLRSCKDLTNQINNVLLTSSPQSDAGETGERKTYNKSTEDCSGSTDSCLFSITEKTFSLKRKLEDESKTGGSADTCKRFKLGGGEKTGDAGWSDVIAEIIDPADFECSLCMRLLYEPVTTPCGHTFCLKCLERCLDHNPKCPLCKEDLSEYLAQRQYCKTILMENLICKYLPTELLERQKANDEEIAELSNLNKNVPIFVCTMAFPWVPCPLHIFEPCYRLMIRRCMETGTKQFGMCLGDSLKGFADYGCILEIRNVEFFADGRSVVDTIGKRRFKVIQHHQRDGYNTADIEYLEDTKVEGVAERELRTLHDAVYDQALIWVSSLKAEQKERIEGHFGPMPEKDSEPQASPNGPSWCWWLLAVLPLEGRAQLPFLALTSLKDRLAGIRRVLFFMARNRSR